MHSTICFEENRIIKECSVSVQHLTLDVIGMFGYKKDFGATEDLCGYGAHVCFLMKEGGLGCLQRGIIHVRCHVWV
jgi:hypothetical protein